MTKLATKRFTKRFYIDEKNPKAYIELLVRPGKKTIELDRIEADVLHAQAGKSLGCMNSLCILREAALGKFPHAVHAVVFDATTAYIIDKITAGRQWKSAVRYKHNDRNGVKIHDQLGPKKIIALGKAVKHVVLSPPKAVLSGASEQKGAHPRSGIGLHRSHKLMVPTGTRRRAKEAGLLLEATVS
jgi:hypothetical protein